MPPTEIQAIRQELGITQGELAKLLGVHPLTVSKWERGLLAPNAHQQELMQSFRLAEQRKPGIGKYVVGVIVGAGVGVGLYYLLRAAFKDK